MYIGFVMTISEPQHGVNLLNQLPELIGSSGGSLQSKEANF